MELLFEKSKKGRGTDYIPPCDVKLYDLPQELKRESDLQIPELAEIDVTRHYSALDRRSRGVNDGFYPLGSCTMKYNPRINEQIAGLHGFANIHPLQPTHTVQGVLEVTRELEKSLCSITGMDRMTHQPAAGAQGELVGLLLIKAYHKKRGDDKRRKILIPDSAHGTNPATASMAGYDVITIPSDDHGCVDIDALKKACSDEIAGLMLTNPNTVGIFDNNICEITEIVHDAGGLCYYDGANLNAIVGLVRPGDMGFDVIHLNLHKSFSTPHGGGGPGSGPVGCKKHLVEFLPGHLVEGEYELTFEKQENSIGEMKAFYGHVLVYLRAYSYILALGNKGIKDVARNAVLNANYMRVKLKDIYDMAFDEVCMHEFIISCADLKRNYNVTALDIAKGLLDYGIHPPTMYFPLIVPEALMVEPTETESKETMDHAIEVFRILYEKAKTSPQELKDAPITTVIGRVDEVAAARHPIVKYDSNRLDDNDK